MDKNLDERVTFETKRDVILSLGVYELRGLARVLGVKSPTTKRREELVSQVLEIVQNNEDISLAEIDRRGRPFKALSSVQNILDVITPQQPIEKELPSRFSSFEELTVFNQELPSFVFQTSDIFPSNGVLRKGKSFGYFVDSTCQRKVYVAPDQVDKHKLVTGDFLDCAVFEINHGDTCYVKKVNRVNGVDADEYEAVDFTDYTQVFPKMIKINDMTINLGGRNVMITETPLYLNNAVVEILETFKKAKRVFVGVNSCFEDKSFIAGYGDIFSFTSSYDGKLLDGYDRIIDAINLIERMKSMNEEVLVVVNDFANILTVLDAYFQDEDEPKLYGRKEKAVVIAKKLISLAMAKSNDKNITCVILCNKLDDQDEFIRNELIKISNKIQ